VGMSLCGVWQDAAVISADRISFPFNLRALPLQTTD